ncbi:MAG: orotate phosphoribosyltransferase [Oscillospiraceae bacterium]|nr:orotate phosphoribosyltransferase [Oscillospiraceae bacterium]
MLTQEEALNLFREARVLLEGHFRLTSGRHSDRYMQCARLFQDPRYAEPLCRSLAERFAGEGIGTVVGPALGAVQMAYAVSRHLECRNAFAERADGTFALRRGFALAPGERVLVVEDAVTTGGSVREVMELVRSLGGEVAGVGALVDRSNGKTDFGVPFRAALTVDVVSWEEADCPLCAQGIPAVKPGSRS